MQISVRSYLTAGVAFVGAGAIAITPISPVNPSLRNVDIPTVTVSSAPVGLAAAVNPIQAWIDVFTNTTENLGILAQRVIADPAPILAKLAQSGIVSTQALAGILQVIAQGFVKGLGETPAAFQSAFQMIAAGDYQNGVPFLFNAALTPILQAFFPVVLGPSLPNLVAVLQNPFDNISKAIATGLPTALGLLGFPLLGIPLTIAGQIGASMQAVANGIEAGDFGSAINAIINFPADLVNSFLNGNPELSLNGLLSPYGIVDGFLNWRKGIADALQPPTIVTPPPVQTFSTAAADEVPGSSAAGITVSLRTDQAGGATAPEADGVGAETALPADPAPVEPTPPVSEEEEPTPPAEEPAPPAEEPAATTEEDEASTPEDDKSEAVETKRVKRAPADRPARTDAKAAAKKTDTDSAKSAGAAKRDAKAQAGTE